MSGSGLRFAVVLASALVLAACAHAPEAPPGTRVTAEQVRAIRPGASSRASLLATLGPTRKVGFESGVETWLYQMPVPGGFDEIVVLLDAQGVVRKLRRRAHIPAH
ncbi:hypothetical protein F2P45_32735 [Massilia sp. CCM 8733]|uniref:Lipoprotein SmpA/OmlA domain-containing protein n=1 Tax=Massilia mucilaginosa TaxID=2609282 RepID=A0ABX0P372_9BURK|nr:outer membrane protein assembly factor BamE [Massilia mucilaginosa]NHZ93730.1 hypothetical protein [Massilia mucilaginosa]